MAPSPAASPIWWIIDAADPLEALTRRADRTHVIKRGRVVAETVTQRRTAWA